jgi:hemerythrin
VLALGVGCLFGFGIIKLNNNTKLPIESIQTDNKNEDANVNKKSLINELFLNYIEQHFSKTEVELKGYKFIDINSDEISELVLKFYDLSYGDDFFDILLINGNNVESIGDSEIYLDKQNCTIKCKYVDPMEHGYEEVYTITNNKFTKIFEGEYYHNWSTDDEGNQQIIENEINYNISGVVCMHEEYDEKLEKVFNIKNSEPIDSNIIDASFTSILTIVNSNDANKIILLETTSNEDVKRYVYNELKEYLEEKDISIDGIEKLKINSYDLKNEEYPITFETTGKTAIAPSTEVVSCSFTGFLRKDGQGIYRISRFELGTAEGEI